MGSVAARGSSGMRTGASGGPAAGCPVDGRVYSNALEPALELPDNYYTHDVADVMFVDAEGGDYHLRAGSPAAGLGASLD